jgi:hypothetical protein
MDMNAINQWCVAEFDGAWRAFNDYSGASIKCSSENSAMAIMWFFEEMAEIGLCDESVIDVAEDDLVRGRCPYAADRIRERYDNAREEIECMMADAMAEFA